MIIIGIIGLLIIAGGLFWSCKNGLDQIVAVSMFSILCMVQAINYFRENITAYVFVPFITLLILACCEFIYIATKNKRR